MKTRALFSLLAVAGIFTGQVSAQTIWEAFNDHRTGGSTSPNATAHEMRVAAGVPPVAVPLRNFATGAELPAMLTVEEEGPGSDDFGSNVAPNPGSPADLLFAGRCTSGVGNDGIVGVRNNEAEVVRLRFTALDPAKRYKFRGTSARGGNYNDRWAIFKIVEADGAVAAHTDGSPNLNLFTATTYPASGILADEVAINTGDNKAGSLAGWDNINPGVDGMFAIEARQYVGPAPFGNPAAGSYGYAFNVLYLAEVPATGGLNITANPENKLVRAGTTAQFTVAATSANPISYQWQSTAPGGDVFSDISGATSATYTTPVLTAAQDNTKFRCRVTAGADSALSGEATLRVDGVIPTIASAAGSTNLNAVYITFSEPMNLAQMASPGNYSINNGLAVTAAAALDPQTVKLSTGSQEPDQPFMVTVNNVIDVAGNPVAPNSTGAFTSYELAFGYASVEIWTGITGDLASLLNDPRYPASPDWDFAAPALDSTTVWPDGPYNTYGGRMRTWIIPAQSGEYHFFLKSDNVGELSISPDASIANLAVIATDTDAATGFQEPGLSTATTATPIALTAGERYALQVVWEEDNGADFCQVAWREAADLTPADQLLPISGPVLSFYAPPAPGTFTSVSNTGGQLRIEWTGPGILQTSADLATWGDVHGATSPYTTPMTPSKKFLRLRR